MERKKVMLSLGNRIRKSRDLAGFTQEQLAEAVGVSRSSVAQYESGEKEPTVQHLAQIAVTLHVSADYLLGIPTTTNMAISMSPEACTALEHFIQVIVKERMR